MSLVTVRNIKAFLERATATGQECYAWVDAHQFVQAMIADLEKPPAGPVTEVSNAQVES